MGAPAATWLATVAGLWLAWVVTAQLVRRVAGVQVWVSLAAASTYVFGAFALGLLANGQLAKLQLWCLPLVLLCADRLIRSEIAVVKVGLVFVSSLVMAFTSPSVALVMPPALVAWVMARAPHTSGGIKGAACALVAAALGLLPAYLYHSAPPIGVPGFVPAMPIPGLEVPSNLSPVVTGAGLLGLGVHWDRAVAAINHVSAVGLPALLVGLLALVRFPRVAAAGLALSAVGVVLALGPEIQVGGVLWLLPASLLERFDYPLKESGMYYRFVQVAALGLAFCMASLAKRRRWLGHVAIVASLLAGVHATAELWPRPIRSVPNAEILASLAEDPRPGAVLEFPLAHIDTEGDHRILAQIIHGRATSVLPRNIVVRGIPRLERLERKSQSMNAAEALEVEGFRYVLLHRPRRESRLLEALTRQLGSPEGNGRLAIWALP